MARQNKAEKKSDNRKKENAGKPGRMPNIYDVAKEARVSVYTVSAVTNNSAQVSAALQKRVQAAIRKLNYRPNLLARSLARRQTHTVGIIVTDIANPFFPLVVRGTEDVLQKSGYSTLLCNSDDDPVKEAHYLEFLLSKRVDGIMLVKTPGPLSPAVRQMLTDVKTPIGLIMRACDGLKGDLVMTDDRLGAFEAVSHLARMGHQRIGFVGGPHNVSNAKSRRQGYLEALQQNSLRESRDLTYEGDYRFESGYRAGLTLLPRRPDAMFVANYLMMVGFMKAADEMGLQCPADFAMVSFDDYPWLGSFHPRMTTVELPKYELGEQSARLLLERISGERTKVVTVKLLPQMRVRESCGFKIKTERTVSASVS